MLRRTTVRQAVMVLAVLTTVLIGPRFAAAADSPYSYKAWPQTPDWIALTNHLNGVYQGILDRCSAAGISTAKFGPPSYVYPLDDYIRFAYYIDEICGNFVDRTKADQDGRFTTYFVPDTYSLRFPMFTPETLHAAAGIDHGRRMTPCCTGGCSRAMRAGSNRR